MNNVTTTQSRDVGVTSAQWNTLKNSLYPGANDQSINLVLDYCRSRGLDPMKKPCHIVPMSVKDAQTGKFTYRDVVMPGIYELRTTAMRTGEYLGHSKPEYGDTIDCGGTSAPEWCEMTIYRWNARAQEKTEFPVRVMFLEAVALKDGKPNQRWAKAPIQMLTKCTEAAGLREAFPDELGGEMAAEEMEGQHYDTRVVATQEPTAKPETAAPQATGNGDGSKPANASQLKVIRAKLDASDTTEEALCEHLAIESLEVLPFAQVNAALSFLQEAAK